MMSYEKLDVYRIYHQATHLFPTKCTRIYEHSAKYFAIVAPAPDAAYDNVLV